MFNAKCLPLGLLDFEPVAAVGALDNHVVILLVVTGKGGRSGCSVLVALKLAVLLLLDVTVEVLDKQVFTQEYYDMQVKGSDVLKVEEPVWLDPKDKN